MTYSRPGPILLLSNNTTREVEVTVGNWNTGGITKIYLKPPQRANEVADVDKVLFGLWNEYDVLVAKTTCVTLTFTSLVDGKLHCMIWGTRSGDEIETNDCYESSYSVCGKLSIAVENNGTDPCQSYDYIDDFTTNSAHNEEGPVV
ncbi:uncharacterized protein LOC142767775 [Rhipicephalus microplus]|uniref:uncharacterized protein LOC142767775 n=1 Tax=Rhipicephalus microplus TaxID=6941 RepID=UPI003F6B88E2